MTSTLRPLLLCLLIVGCAGAVRDAVAMDKPGIRSERTPILSAGTRYGPDNVYAKIPERDEFGRDQLSMFNDWNSDPVGRNEASLRAINPTLAKVVRAARLVDPGLRFVIGSGKRDDRLQRKAVAWGWSRTPYSPHLRGDAVDLWPLDADGHIDFDPTAQIRIGAAMKKAAAAQGVPIRWGGTFHGFKDRDRSHFELVPD
jgi:hypothetical protein